MAKRKRRKSRRQKLLPAVRHSADFQEIVRLFIKPLLNMPDMETLSVNERLNVIFGVKFREILLARALTGFDMPGKVYTPGEFRPPMTHEQRVPKTASLVIRLDERTPDRIDVEVIHRDGFSVVFVLTKLEYINILGKFEEVAGCNRLLIPPGIQGKERDDFLHSMSKQIAMLKAAKKRTAAMV